MKFGLSEYMQPTPKKVRKLADSLSAAAIATSGIAFTQDYKVMAYAVLVAAFAGKFFSNLFSEDNVQQS
jgi:hypothetical protein